MSAEEQIVNAANYGLYVSGEFSSFFFLASEFGLEEGVQDGDVMRADKTRAVDAGCKRFYQPPIVSEDDELRH